MPALTLFATVVRLRRRLGAGFIVVLLTVRLPEVILIAPVIVLTVPSSYAPRWHRSTFVTPATVGPDETVGDVKILRVHQRLPVVTRIGPPRTLKLGHGG